MDYLNHNVSTIDTTIVILFIIGTLVIGYFISKSVKGFDDFALGGRSFGPFMLAITFGATNFSAWSLVGKPGVVYSAGIPIVWIALNALACVMAAVCFAPVYRKLRYTTMSEIFEDRYDGRVRGLISVIWVIADTMNRFGVTVYAGAIIIAMIFGLNLSVVIIATSIVVLIYTVLGGLRSVVITDIFHFGFMWIGLFIGALFIFIQFGGWNELVASIPSYMSEWVPSAQNANGWPWIIAMTLLGFPYFITSQFIMQRGLGAKNVNVARWGLLIAGLIAIPMALLEILPGLAARTLLNPADTAVMPTDAIGIAVYIELLPVGILGIFIAAIVAAAFSTADSAMCASSTLVTEDFYRKIKPDRSSKHYLKVSRITTVVVAILGTIWALLVPVMGGALSALLTVVAITDMPIFVVVVMAVFWKRINAMGALCGIIAGTVGGAIAAFTGAGGIQGLAATTFASTSIALVVCVVASYVTKRNAAEEGRLDAFFAKLAAPSQEG